MEGATTYNYTVGMTCQGCANAITKILDKIEGISSKEINVDAKTVKIVGKAGLEETITAKLSKWGNASGKEVTFTGN
eukprot:CAMPEP_0115006632 /NCGR_PEP_ID=MMETSP0216-20121206/20621_1 /TAXON_ID=223996 /ORGANISM="Protocruzia adherens, Strain Boccale" /LENGTH=76 /DNA_ID=CAMNT_0002373263 /DNA_START=50 /DNA_END=280 /DNA_ORIENTATION=-